MASGVSSSDIPLSLLNGLPALEPPAGIVPNFTNPPSDGSTMIGLASTFLALCTIFFGARCFNKAFIIREVSLDDLTCCTGFPLMLVIYVGMMYSTIEGPSGKHQWDVHLGDMLGNTYVIGAAFLVVAFNPLARLFINETFFLLFLQVFRPFEWMRIVCYVGTAINIAFYGAVAIVQFYFVTPGPGQSWQTHAISGNLYNANILSTPLAGVNLGLDVFLFLLPLVTVSKLKLSPRRKLGVMVLFATGFLAVISSVLSLIYRIEAVRSLDTTWANAPTELCSATEMQIGIICTCMPSVSKLVHHYSPTLHISFSAIYKRFTRPASRSDTGKSTDGDIASSTRYQMKQDSHLQYDVESGDGAKNFMLSNQLDSPQPMPSPPTINELEQYARVKTFIGTGRQMEPSAEDQIQLAREILQRG